MTQIEKLRPLKVERVMDLVAIAGIDVSDWSNISGGKSKAASNPKYCYEWAYVESNKVVVLNLWFERLREELGTVFQEENLRTIARYSSLHSAQVRRAKAADDAIRIAFEGLIPIRAIINDGLRKKGDVAGASSVKARTLDPVVWHVGSYNYLTGEAVLVRGPRGKRYVDQFSALQDIGERPLTREVKGEVFVRNAKVRNAALNRAGGCCELCKEPGFSMPNGTVYLETHHIISLGDGGPDTEANVIALCPNHHRRAHFGVDREELQRAFTRIIGGASKTS